jgi:hypothetical protein
MKTTSDCRPAAIQGATHQLISGAEPSTRFVQLVENAFSRYWNVGIVEYWGRTATKSLEMSVPQDGFIALKPIVPSFHYSNIPTFPGNGLLAEPS